MNKWRGEKNICMRRGRVLARVTITFSVKNEVRVIYPVHLTLCGRYLCC